MRIFERNTNQVFEEIEIFLTLEEANELCGRLDGLISNLKAHHIHLDSDNKELMVAIYTKENLDEFDERSRELILKGV